MIGPDRSRDSRESLVTADPHPPPPVFRKYVIPKGLWKSTVQVCVPKGFESLCFDIDVRFLGSMCAERVYGGGIHKNVKRKELRVEGRKRRAGKGEAPVPVLRFQSATNFRGPIRNANCAHLTFPFPFLTYCGLSGGLKADLPGGPAITTEVRIAQMTRDCQGLI